MKRFITIILFILIFNLQLLNSWYYDTSSKYVKYYKEFVKWEFLYIAICKVESNCDPTKIGRQGDGGIIQILPENTGGYLDEANRLLGYRRFKNADRFNPIKSREIWDIVMKHRNPEKNILKAIKLHNPRAGKWYKEKVMREFLKLLNHDGCTKNFK